MECRATFSEDGVSGLVKVIVTESTFKFTTNGIDHFFKFTNNNIMYTKSGAINTVITFDGSKKSEFEYVISETGQKICGTIQTILIDRMNGCGFEIKYISDIGVLQKSGSLKLKFEESCDE